MTICEKPNVLRETSGMMEEVAKEVQKQYSDIPLWSTNIDAQTMWLTKNPEDYGVIVASNLFGDVISDAFAGLVGGLGFAASGNIGDEVAVFEPTHGSAPKYAELNPPIVNPIAMILSAAMMLDHLGENDKARKIRDAIAAVVAEGKVRTYDMLRIPGGAKSLAQGAASTTQMTDAILAKLGVTGGEGVCRQRQKLAHRDAARPDAPAATSAPTCTSASKQRASWRHRDRTALARRAVLRRRDPAAGARCSARARRRACVRSRSWMKARCRS